MATARQLGFLSSADNQPDHRCRRILTKHDRIQDIDELVQIEAKGPGATPDEKDRRALLQALKGR
jgi:hypothetical protein